MKSTVKRATEITLVLNEKEATFLRAFCQNGGKMNQAIMPKLG